VFLTRVPAVGLISLHHKRRQYLPYLAWTLLLFTVLFWRLGVASFWDPDEAHYAETSHELVLNGDWLVPTYNDEPFFDKPILFHWLQALPIRLFGPTEFAARLVPTLATLALIAVTWWLGVTLGSAEVGLVAGMLLTVNPAAFALSRYAILDTVFTAFLFGGVALVAVAALRNRPRLQYVGYISIGLATLTKGPIALVLCGVAFALTMALSTDARVRLLRLRWIRGAIIAVAVSAPWFVYMVWRFDGIFVEQYWLNENVVLFTRPPYGNQPPWYFYVQILASGLLPWTGLLIGRLYDDVHGAIVRRRAPDTFEMLLWAWTIAIVGFFSMSQFRLDHYIFPAAPAVCLLCARAWAEIRARGLDGIDAGARLGFRLVGPTLIAAGAIGAFVLMTRFSLPSAALSVPIVVVGAGATLVIRSILPNARVPRVPWVVIGAFGFTYVGVIVWVAPVLEQWKVMPDVAEWVAAHAGPDDRIAAYRLNRWTPAFRFYVKRHTAMLESIEEARQMFNRPGGWYCVMSRSSFEELVVAGVPLEIAYSREGLRATSGRALWRQRDPLTRFLVVKRAPAGRISPTRTIRPPPAAARFLRSQIRGTVRRDH
jgi:4-amino-4-deoxy-L-arabinose transferase-like glycosyltransferase